MPKNLERPPKGTSNAITENDKRKHSIERPVFTYGNRRQRCFRVIFGTLTDRSMENKKETIFELLRRSCLKSARSVKKGERRQGGGETERVLSVPVVVPAIQRTLLVRTDEMAPGTNRLTPNRCRTVASKTYGPFF